MKLAVFTSQFPGPTCTFFARDMRGLIDSGIDIDVFSIYPLEPALWRYVPDTLNEKILPRSRVHHLMIRECLRSASFIGRNKLGRFLGDAVSISTSATVYGVSSLAKSGYVLPKAWTWAHQYSDRFDHVLAYWGNYTATCAYLFHRLSARAIPFSLFLHAGTDLYRGNVYLRQKLLYADNVITCSDFNRQYIQARFANVAERTSSKIYVHHHGLDLSEFSFELNRKLPPRVIAVGRIEREKGYDYLVRALHRLEQMGTKVKIEIVGDGSQTQYLKSLSHELGVADRVTFRGWLTPEETKRAISQAAVLVHPAATLGDGVPNVIKESMALGTPVIASEIAGIPELLQGGKHGVLVPPRDIDALARAIEQLLQNYDVRSRYAESARRHVELKFDLWRNGQQLSAILTGSARTSDGANEPGAI
jgi:glycosyltransferase involved in cell wall biosynthesis